METIIAEPIRRDSKLTERIAEAMHLLDREAGKFASLVRAEWSVTEDRKQEPVAVHLALRNVEFPDVVVEAQFTSEELKKLLATQVPVPPLREGLPKPFTNDPDTLALQDRLHRTWTRVLAEHSDALGRRIAEMLRDLDED